MSQIPKSGKRFRPEQIEFAKLYWEEFKYRHGLYWSMFFRFSFAILFVLAVPFLHPEKMVNFRTYTAIFPLTGMLLSFAASWLLAAEYARIRTTYQKYSEIRTPAYNPGPIPQVGIHRVLRIRIGTGVTLFFLLGFFSLSLGAFVVLRTSTHDSRPAATPLSLPSPVPGTRAGGDVGPRGELRPDARSAPAE